MSKNIIWILVIGFVLGFISREQWNTESWEFVFLAMQGIGSILVPVVIFWWANRDQRKKDDLEKLEKKKDKDKETILTYVREELIPLSLENNDIEKIYQSEIKHETKIKNIIVKCGLKFISLKDLISTLSSYSYMYEFIDLLEVLSKTIRDSKNINIHDLLNAWMGFSANISYMESLIAMDETQYQEKVLSRIMIFILRDGEIKNIALEVFKDFPQYYEHAKNYIKEAKEEEEEEKNKTL